MGMYAQAAFENDSEGFILYFASVLEGWSKEEIQVYLAHFRREIRLGQKHGWYWQKNVWARKPEA